MEQPPERGEDSGGGDAGNGLDMDEGSKGGKEPVPRGLEEGVVRRLVSCWLGLELSGAVLGEPGEHWPWKMDEWATVSSSSLVPCVHCADIEGRVGSWVNGRAR